MTWGIVATVGSAVVGGAIASRGAEKAGDVQAGSALAGIAEQRRQFDITQEQFAPFREAGVAALGQQQALLGIGGPEEQQAAFAAFADTPGQQFLRQQQERALLRNASAIGGLGGGNIRRALQEQAFGRAQTDLANQFNRLSSITGGGQTATQGLATAGGQTASNIANLQQAGGQARASGILGAAQAQTQTISQLPGILAQYGVFKPAPTTVPIAA